VVATEQAVEELFNLSHLRVDEDSVINLKEFPELSGTLIFRTFTQPISYLVL
jgi:hypothetical protein